MPGKSKITADGAPAKPHAGRTPPRAPARADGGDPAGPRAAPAGH